MAIGTSELNLRWFVSYRTNGNGNEDGKNPPPENGDGGDDYIHSSKKAKGRNQQGEESQAQWKRRDLPSFPRDSHQNTQYTGYNSSYNMPQDYYSNRNLILFGFSNVPIHPPGFPVYFRSNLIPFGFSNMPIHPPDFPVYFRSNLNNHPQQFNPSGPVVNINTFYHQPSGPYPEQYIPHGYGPQANAPYQPPNNPQDNFQNSNPYNLYSNLNQAQYSQPYGNVHNPGQYAPQTYGPRESTPYQHPHIPQENLQNPNAYNVCSNPHQAQSPQPYAYPHNQEQNMHSNQNLRYCNCQEPKSTTSSQMMKNGRSNFQHSRVEEVLEAQSNRPSALDNALDATRATHALKASPSIRSSSRYQDSRRVNSSERPSLNSTELTGDIISSTLKSIPSRWRPSSKTEVTSKIGPSDHDSSLSNTSVKGKKPFLSAPSSYRTSATQTHKDDSVKIIPPLDQISTMQNAGKKSIESISRNQNLSTPVLGSKFPQSPVEKGISYAPTKPHATASQDWLSKGHMTPSIRKHFRVERMGITPCKQLFSTPAKSGKEEQNLDKITTSRTLRNSLAHTKPTFTNDRIPSAHTDSKVEGLASKETKRNSTFYNGEDHQNVSHMDSNQQNSVAIQVPATSSLLPSSGVTNRVPRFIPNPKGVASSSTNRIVVEESPLASTSQGPCTSEEIPSASTKSLANWINLSSPILYKRPDESNWTEVVINMKYDVPIEIHQAALDNLMDRASGQPDGFAYINYETINCITGLLSKSVSSNICICTTHWLESLKEHLRAVSEDPILLKGLKSLKEKNAEPFFSAINLVIIPYHDKRGEHWILLCLDKKTKDCFICDSMRHSSSPVQPRLQRDLEQIIPVFQYTFGDLQPWDINRVDCVQQTDLVSCGLYLISNVELAIQVTQGNYSYDRMESSMDLRRRYIEMIGISKPDMKNQVDAALKTLSSEFVTSANKG
ncbi:hypothetical protein BTUL_0386g00010 [Botrytis tulipae]|uniref:Ubiquitin-like protease family profile domain-containing protein n=1 Tax=Botrytis tulipae TaxID=87230 RepID=A0A4Z1E8Q1_9HELO|nr:hypothetical protein BTUL_0386g00010 [Botrytis tulipae]